MNAITAGRTHTALTAAVGPVFTKIKLAILAGVETDRRLTAIAVFTVYITILIIIDGIVAKVFIRLIPGIA